MGEHSRHNIFEALKAFPYDETLRALASLNKALLSSGQPVEPDVNVSDVGNAYAAVAELFEMVAHAHAEDDQEEGEEEQIPAVPETRDELLQALGLKELTVQSDLKDNWIVSFGLGFKTLDDRIFFFNQDMEIKPNFKSVEVLDCTDGDGHNVSVYLGSTFKDCTENGNLSPRPDWECLRRKK